MGNTSQGSRGSTFSRFFPGGSTGTVDISVPDNHRRQFFILPIPTAIHLSRVGDPSGFTRIRPSRKKTVSGLRETKAPDQTLNKKADPDPNLEKIDTDPT